MNIILDNEKICLCIKELYISRKTMDYSHISKRRFNKIISNKVMPSLRNLIAVSNAFNVKIDDLLFYTVI